MKHLIALACAVLLSACGPQGGGGSSPAASAAPLTVTAAPCQMQSTQAGSIGGVPGTLTTYVCGTQQLCTATVFQPTSGGPAQTEPGSTCGVPSP